MVPRTGHVDVDAATVTWLVNAAVEGGREDIVGALVAEVEDENNRRRAAGQWQMRPPTT
jgi:hypothetical protein